MNKALPRALIASGVVFTFALATIFSFFASMHADDFCRAALPVEPRFWLDYAKERYLNWTGRWVAMSLYAATFPVLQLDGKSYTVITLISLPLFTAAFWMAFRAVSVQRRTGLSSVGYALMAVAAYWAHMREPGETWYWATGFVEYQIPFLLSVLFALLCIALWSGRGRPVRKMLITVAAAVIAIICSGMNELASLYIIGFASVSLALAILSNERLIGIISLVLVVIALASLYFTVSAPGNDIRIAQDFTNSGKSVYILRSLLSSLDHSTLNWVINPTLLALSVLIMTDRKFSEQSATMVELFSARLSCNWPWHILVPGAVLVAIFAGRLVLAYSQSAPIVGRLSNLLFAYYMVGLIVALPFLSAHLQRRRSALPRASAVQSIAAAVFFLGLVSSPNVAAAIDQLPQSALWWKHDMARRVTAIEQAASSATRIAVLEPLRFSPSLTLAQEFGTDPDNWVNKCAAQFYNLEAITTHP